ncbi:PIG-L deacetylase family protein [Arthrobacter sp. H20]|uniref:PIG-L deacetylase family protein n=1 Tax=Arthrobacter sp. H20 TaxID=1267981 RepID=UPI0004AED2AA|nr:PIG-L deacetylase family protein [Arthrobacter sp. H20]
MQPIFDASRHRISRVLCFAAHPDDIDFGAAGTVAQFTGAGVQVDYCIMTDGDAGGFDDAQRSSMVQLRRTEQRAAAAQVGVRDIHYLGELDGFLAPSNDLIKRVVEVIRRVRPDVVLSMHPERNWDRIQKSHPDHLACGETVTRAVYPAAENPYAFPELEAASLASHKVSWLWLYAGPTHLENHYVDITDTVEDKLRALHFHTSQHPDADRMDVMVRQLLRDNASRGGLPPGTSAEAFHVVPVNSDQTISGF